MIGNANLLGPFSILIELNALNVPPFTILILNGAGLALSKFAIAASSLLLLWVLAVFGQSSQLNLFGQRSGFVGLALGTNNLAWLPGR